MNPDIADLLQKWEYEPHNVQARTVVTEGGREVLQMRIDLGILQLEANGRPDGTRPHGFETYLDYLRNQKKKAEKGKRTFVLDEDQCQEADREFMQFYHRRICWLTLRRYDMALRDADHTLSFMDFVSQHSPTEEYKDAHEQYRGFVLFQRTQAAAAWEVDRENPEAAINAVKDGLEQLRQFFAAYELEEQMQEDGMVQHLIKVEAELRREFQIGDTLEEQLAKAVADEDYEKAARLRDQIKQKS